MIDKAAVPLGRGLGCQVQGAAGLKSGSADCVRKLVGNLEGRGRTGCGTMRSFHGELVTLE